MILVGVFWLVGILLIIAQTTLVPYFPQWFGRPDFIFILVAFAAYRFAWIPGILLVFSLGWIVDVVAAVHLGVYPLICLLTFAALKTLTQKSPIKESTYQIPLVGVSYFATQLIFYLLYMLFLPEILPEWSWGQTLRLTLLMVVATIPFFLLFNSLYEYLRRRRPKAKVHRRQPVA